MFYEMVYEMRYEMMPCTKYYRKNVGIEIIEFIECVTGNASY